MLCCIALQLQLLQMWLDTSASCNKTKSFLQGLGLQLPACIPYFDSDHLYLDVALCAHTHTDTQTHKHAHYRTHPFSGTLGVGVPAVHTAWTMAECTWARWAGGPAGCPSGGKPLQPLWFSCRTQAPGRKCAPARIQELSTQVQLE